MTLGHFDLIKRASKLYDRLVVAVAATSAKQGARFSAEDRLAMIREDVKKARLRNVEVKMLDGLLVEFCRREKAKVVIRGVRVYSDFEYEFQMALTNRRMAPEIDSRDRDALHDAEREPRLRHGLDSPRDRGIRR